MAQKKNEKKKSKTGTKSEAATKEKKKSKHASGENQGGGPPMPKFKNVAKKLLTTGKGATPAEIGKSLVDLFNQGKAEEVIKQWYSKKIESIEGDGRVFLGMKGIKEKNAWWYGTFETHSAVAEGPFIGATGFTVHFSMEISPKAGGERMKAREVGVYTVSKGKIIREEFMGLGC